MEYILQNTLLALLEYPDSTLLDVNRMLTNKNFRAAVIEKISDDQILATFEEPQRAVSPGQAAVFYDGDIVVGGGWIA